MRKKQSYAFELENIINFVFDDSMVNNTEITESYGTGEDSSDMTLLNRIIRDVKNNSDTQAPTIKYDLVKMLIGEILTSDGENITFGEEVVLNTLMESKLIKKID